MRRAGSASADGVCMAMTPSAGTAVGGGAAGAGTAGAGASGSSGVGVAADVAAGVASAAAGVASAVAGAAVGAAANSVVMRVRASRVGVMYVPETRAQVELITDLVVEWRRRTTRVQ